HHWPELELYFAGAGGGGQSAKAGQESNAGRSLDPIAGRFASQDPIKDDEKNLYRYVGNNPVNKTDPSGLKTAIAGQASQLWWIGDSRTGHSIHATLVGIDGDFVLLRDKEGQTVSHVFSALIAGQQSQVIQAVHTSSNEILDNIALSKGLLSDDEKDLHRLLEKEAYDLFQGRNLKEAVSLFERIKAWSIHLEELLSQKRAVQKQEDAFDKEWQSQKEAWKVRQNKLSELSSHIYYLGFPSSGRPFGRHWLAAA
ncbi:MAG: hypothetical protein K8T91_06765, partial [Planctomycetes bacterium]|nr:hypothetical protein [Planctomycetota bacterium]